MPTEVELIEARPERAEYLRRMAAPPPGDFDAVLARHGAAHNNDGTDKATNHAYGPLYADVFRPLRDRARRVLEIGVYSGASALAMAEYLPGAAVEGLDVDLSRVKFGAGHPRVKFHEGDGTLPATAVALSFPGAPWDLVLDDASHRPADQLASFAAFAPFVAPGGVYIIEDIQSEAELKAPLRALAQAHGFQRLEWVDLRHLRGVRDDLVALVHK